ncbi:MAG: acyl carrier protein [Haliea sp.]|nr:acyl carrier protein [Haliea sp.]MBK6737209.1 acyl carrier protein [Haliea sp.]
MQALDLAKKVIAVNLQLELDQLSADTEILGNFPQFNSLTIVGVIGSIEDELDCVIDDEEINTEIFATVGDLAAFIQSRMR